MPYYQVIVQLPGTDNWEPIIGFDAEHGHVVWRPGEQLTRIEAATRRNNLAAENPQYSFKVEPVNG